ncbi:cell wall-binding repeat-containing protein [Mesobacillus selenatarsenatis]|uniref:Cell wall lytic activity n=1 Tax=Mesobacillus selenatarsenatis (strain DSM 18680 / JCM 14380 / FERM P-15431 / SF-1) TaxID=1321606 RepID=A0A0A8WZ39_MESS1|nr:cell wall-binding repeat-containing protein [Mesobacillus selenatarsenatis]GAM12017.1 cell wall lytic activity [Mesobacillus selenatarsenatis SF-1]
MTLNFMRKGLQLGFLTFLVTLGFVFLDTDRGHAVEIDRIYGQNRYETSIHISQKGWPDGAETVIFAVGNNFPDALAGVPLAHKLNAPMLLTDKNYLPVSVKKEIGRLNAKKAILLGGSQVISSKVETELDALGLSVIRYAGKNRFETAAQIAKEVGNGKAVIANGYSFPDSLAIASYAANNQIPILLTNKDNLPQETKEVIGNFKDTLVIGGSAVVNDNVLGDLPNPERISGSDRYDTAAKIVESLFEPTLEKSFMATGESFADALTGSVLAAKYNRPMILTRSSNLSSSAYDLIQKKNVERLTVIGGAGVVSDAALSKLNLNVDKIIETAKSLQGTKYVWGGTTTQGFDCSGYLNYVYDAHGINLPRTTADIWNSGIKVDKPQVGDIVFFETYQPGPSHAGIYIGNNSFIHASSSYGVTITSMDNVYFKPRYLGAKRVF